MGDDEYTIVWVSPITGAELMRDGGMFADENAAVRWAKGLVRRREVNGVSKGRLYRVARDGSWKDVCHVGSGG